jgi:hypothetical protein
MVDSAIQFGVTVFAASALAVYLEKHGIQRVGHDFFPPIRLIALSHFSEQQQLVAFASPRIHMKIEMPLVSTVAYVEKFTPMHSYGNNNATGSCCQPK